MHDKYDVFFQNVNSDGSLDFGINGKAITIGNKTQEGPIVRPDLNLGAFIVWGDYRTGSPGVYLQHIDDSGELSLGENGTEMYWGIDGNTVSTYATKPTSCYIGNNQAVIGWSDQRFGAGEVINFGQKIYNNWDNSQQQDGYQLSSYLSYNENGEVSGGHDFPSINTIGQNIIHFFPTQSPVGPSLRYQVLDQDLNMIGSNQGQLVNETDFPQFWDTFKYVNASDGFGYLVFSEQLNFFAYTVLLQKFDSSGNAVFSNPVNLTPDAFGDKNVKNIHEIEGVGFVVIFQSESWLTGLTVEYVVVDYDGNLLSESGLLVDDSGENQIYQSSASTNFGVFVSYLKESGSDSDVYAQLISSSGELLGNSSGISIVSRVGKQDNVTTAYNPVLEEVMVCYQDRINDLYYDISCSALDSSLSLSDELIVADLSNVNQVEPFVYSTLDGSYLVVWQDDRNYSGTLAGNEDIYLQQITNGSVVHQQNGIAVCNESYFPQKKSSN